MSVNADIISKLKRPIVDSDSDDDAIDPFKPSRDYRTNTTKKDFDLKDYPVIEEEDILKKRVQDPHRKYGETIDGDDINGPKIVEHQQYLQVLKLKNPFYRHASRVATVAFMQLDNLVTFTRGESSISNKNLVPENATEKSLMEKLDHYFQSSISASSVDEDEKKKLLEQANKNILELLSNLDMEKIPSVLVALGNKIPIARNYMEAFEQSGRMVLSGEFLTMNELALKNLTSWHNERGDTIRYTWGHFVFLVMSEDVSILTEFANLVGYFHSEPLSTTAIRPWSELNQNQLNKKLADLRKFFLNVYFDSGTNKFYYKNKDKVKGGLEKNTIYLTKNCSKKT